MEKTYKRVPFDIELANKIQAGEIEGKIVTNLGETVRIICFDVYKIHADYELVALVKCGDSDEAIGRYDRDGHLVGVRDKDSDLVLEVPVNKPQFKPFDKVLVRDDSKNEWIATFFSHYYYCEGKEHYYTSAGTIWRQCIPYEGNEHLVGTTDNY